MNGTVWPELLRQLVGVNARIRIRESSRHNIGFNLVGAGGAGEDETGE